MKKQTFSLLDFSSFFLAQLCLFKLPVKKHREKKKTGRKMVRSCKQGRNSHLELGSSPRLPNADERKGYTIPGQAL